MVRTEDIIEVYLEKKDIDIINEMSRLCEIGGKSNVMKDRRKRIEELPNHQKLGQLGTYAFHIYLFNDNKIYIKGREKANANPYKGDGGQDVLNQNIDVKTTTLRNNQPLSHLLLVHQNEYHDNWIYVFCLVNPKDLWKTDLAVVQLIGWATSDMLSEVGVDSRFPDTKLLQGFKLNPLARQQLPTNQNKYRKMSLMSI